VDTYNEEIYGKVLWECCRSNTYIVLMSLLYVIMSAGAIIMAITHDLNHGIILYIVALAVIAFSLFRIHKLHCPVALICEKKLLVAVPWSFVNSDYYISLRSFYMPVDYKEVAGVSSGWNRLYIGARITGGIVALPVQLSYVSLGDKIYFQDWVERKQEEAV